MPYFTLDDVRAGMPAGIPIDKTSFPSMDWVAQEIIGVENQVDAACKKGGVTLPIVDASALGVVRIKGAREIRYQVMAMRAAAKSEKIEPLYFEWHEEFTDPEDRTGLIEQIEDNGLGGLVTDSGEPWCTSMDSVEGDEFSARVTKDRVF